METQTQCFSLYFVRFSRKRQRTWRVQVRLNSNRTANEDTFLKIHLLPYNVLLQLGGAVLCVFFYFCLSIDMRSGRLELRRRFEGSSGLLMKTGGQILHVYLIDLSYIAANQNISERRIITLVRLNAHYSEYVLLHYLTT